MALRVRMIDKNNGYVTDDAGTLIYKIVPRWVADLAWKISQTKKS